MNFRDYVAALAMQALLSNPETTKIMSIAADGEGARFALDIAEASYEIADAMLAYRDKDAP